MGTLDEIAPLKRRIEALEAVQRHQQQLACNRCGTTLTLCCSVAADLHAHLIATALQLGWLVSVASRNKVADQTDDPDLCAFCVSVLRIAT